MAHYAILDSNNIVIQVHVGKNEDEGDTDWEEYYGAKRTSYNTYGGVHSTGGTPFRKNYAGIGYTFDSGRDAFIPPKPYPSWILDEGTCLWEAPIPHPDSKRIHQWNEDAGQWEDASPPQPHPSWTQNEETGFWEPPVAYPLDGNRYEWDEENGQWVEIGD